MYRPRHAFPSSLSHMSRTRLGDLLQSLSCKVVAQNPNLEDQETASKRSRPCKASTSSTSQMSDEHELQLQQPARVPGRCVTSVTNEPEESEDPSAGVYGAGLRGEIEMFHSLTPSPRFQGKKSGIGKPPAISHPPPGSCGKEQHVQHGGIVFETRHHFAKQCNFSPPAVPGKRPQ